jgi:hypothetical protein
MKWNTSLLSNARLETEKNRLEIGVDDYLNKDDSTEKTSKEKSSLQNKSMIKI